MAAEYQKIELSLASRTVYRQKKLVRTIFAVESIPQAVVVLPRLLECGISRRRFRAFSPTRRTRSCGEKPISQLQ